MEEELKMEIRNKNFELILSQNEINNLEGEFFSLMTNMYEKDIGADGIKRFSKENETLHKLYTKLKENIRSYD
jgi:hypothetical protein